jgi:hypothetical protein
MSRSISAPAGSSPVLGGGCQEVFFNPLSASLGSALHSGCLRRSVRPGAGGGQKSAAGAADRIRPRGLFESGTADQQHASGLSHEVSAPLGTDTPSLTPDTSALHGPNRAKPFEMRTHRSSQTLQTAQRVTANVAAGFGGLRWRERAVVCFLLAAAALPPAASIYADWLDPKGDSLLGAVGLHPMPAAGLTAVLCFAALLWLENPKRLSMRAYVAQLRDRVEDVHARIARAQETENRG